MNGADFGDRAQTVEMVFFASIWATEESDRRDRSHKLRAQLATTNCSQPLEAEVAGRPPEANELDLGQLRATTFHRGGYIRFPSGICKPEPGS